MRAANTRITKPSRCAEDIRKSTHIFYPKELKGEFSEALRGRMDAGLEFEASLVEQFHELFDNDPSVVFLEGGSDREQWKKDTFAALNDPSVRLVVNPSLGVAPTINLSGDPDFLIRSQYGDWLPLDAKNHKEYPGTSKKQVHVVSTLAQPFLEDAEKRTDQVGTPHQDDSIQLAHYVEMLKEFGLLNARHGAWGGIIGTSGEITWRRLDIPLSRTAKYTPLQILNDTLQERTAIIRQEEARAAGNPRALPLVGPVKIADCGDCPWRDVCFKEMESQDHPSLLPGVTKAAWEMLRNAGVTTRFQLAQLDHHTARVMGLGADIPKLQAVAAGLPDTTPLVAVASITAKWRNALASEGVTTVGDLMDLHDGTLAVGTTGVKWLARAIDQARSQQDGRVYLERDVDFVGFQRAGIEIDIDIEDSDGYVYLFGALVSGRKTREGRKRTRSEYHSFTTWDETSEGEAKAFADFWNFLVDTIAYAKENKYGVRIYHYSHHEVTAFKRLAELHAGAPGVPTLQEVEDLIAWDGWVDLLPIVKKQMIWPTAGYSIKDLAKYARHTWTGDEASGALSLIQYDNAINNPDPEEQEIAREELLIYNREDNEATLRLRDWISALSLTERRPGEKLDSISARDGFWNNLRAVR